MKIVIIGNSAAGTAAIESIRQHDRQCSIIQLSDEAQPLYSRCLLSYYLAGSIDREKLLYRAEGFHKEKGVELQAGPGFRVVALNTAQRQVTCDNGRTFEYDRLLIATGASAQIPTHIPKDIDGVFVLRNLADAESIKRAASTARESGRAVVIGGGLIGMKAATALNECGMKTTVVIRSDRVLSQMIDQAAARVISKQLSDHHIEVLYHTDIVEVISKKGSATPTQEGPSDHLSALLSERRGFPQFPRNAGDPGKDCFSGKLLQTINKEGKLTGVKTDQGQVIDCDLLIAAKGVNPNTELIRDTGIEKAWGIKTDAYMQTNREGIFAAGDVAEAYDIVVEGHTVNALWTCAVQQGRIAGLNMIDKKVPYNGAVGMNSLNVCDISLISFGITAPKDVSKYKLLVLDRPERNLYKKIVIDAGHRIKGIILVGKIANAGVLLSLIQRKIEVSGYEEELLSDRFNFGTLLKYGGKSELDRYYNTGI